MAINYLFIGNVNSVKTVNILTLKGLNQEYEHIIIMRKILVHLFIVSAPKCLLDYFLFCVSKGRSRQGFIFLSAKNDDSMFLGW